MKSIPTHSRVSNRVTTHPNKAERRNAAKARQEEYDALSLQQKYDRAVERGHENTREAKRLKGLLDKQST